MTRTRMGIVLAAAVACHAGTVFAQTAPADPGGVPDAPAPVIRLEAEPTWTRTRNDTNILAGGDVQVRATYVVRDAEGRPRPDLELVLYARGDGPLATASTFTDARGVATLQAFFPISPGIAVTLQACLRGDAAVCSPQRTLSLRQRVVVSADTLTSYSFVPNLPQPDAAGVPICAQVRDCDAILWLFSWKSLHSVRATLVGRARLTLRERARRGVHTSWSVYAALPVSHTSDWAASLVGSRVLDSGLRLGSLSVGTSVSGPRGFVQAAINSHMPASLSGANDGPGFADEFVSLDLGGQISTWTERPITGMAGLSHAFDRSILTGVTLQRDPNLRAAVAVATLRSGSHLAVSPMAGISRLGAVRLVSGGTPTTVRPAMTDLTAGVQVSDLRGGPLGKAVGVSASGLLHGRPTVTFYLALNAKELFVIR